MAEQRQGERVNQKRRTRAALLASARLLLEEGKSPTVAEVADAALVSRATAYRYFPTQDALLAEAALSGRADPAIEAGLAELLAASGDAEQRLHALIGLLQAQVIEHEDGFRRMLRHTLDGDGDGGAGAAPIRGGRRIAWIEAALEPVRERLAPAALDRLVAALSLCMGIEAHLVLHDVCGLEPAAAAEVARGAASALLHDALAGQAGPAQTRGSASLRRARRR